MGDEQQSVEIPPLTEEVPNETIKRLCYYLRVPLWEVHSDPLFPKFKTEVSDYAFVKTVSGMNILQVTFVVSSEIQQFNRIACHLSPVHHR